MRNTPLAKHPTWVLDSTEPGTPSLQAPPVTGEPDLPKGRRRPPDPQEQARRRLWGKTWGKINSMSASRLKEGQT